MNESRGDFSPEATRVHLQQLQEELAKLREQARQVDETIAREQAEVSRSRQQDRRRAEMNRSAAIPALQLQRQRVRAEIFRVEQEIRALRDKLGD